MNRAFLAVLSLVSLALLQYSCVQAIEGCVDPLASNYDLMVEEVCRDSCCTYPSFSLTINYMADSLTLDSADYYVNQLGSYFRLRSFYMVLSEFAFEGDFGAGEIINDGNDVILDDLALIFYRNSSISPGNLRLDGASLEQVNFHIGLPSTLENINVSQDYKVLTILRDSVYLDSMTNQFYEIGFEIEVDSFSKEKEWFQYSNVDYATQKPVNKEISKGNTIRFQLNIDFMRLFNDIDFQSIDLNAKIEDALNLKLVEAITIE